MSSPRGTNNLSPFDPISPDNRSESPSGALSMDKESIDRLVEASAAEAEAANAVWQAAQAQAANPEDTSVADDNAQAAESNSEGSDGEGDVRLHPRAVSFSCFLKGVWFCVLELII
jgi:protein phosphatase